METKNYFWRFTFVNRFTLEKVEEVFCFASNLPNATRKVRKLFSCALYDVESCHPVKTPSLVIVGYSNVEDLL